MNPCYYVEYADGHRIIYSEERFREEERVNHNGREVVSSERWFKADTCRRVHPGVDYHV